MTVLHKARYSKHSLLKLRKSLSLARSLAVVDDIGFRHCFSSLYSVLPSLRGLLPRIVLSGAGVKFNDAIAAVPGTSGTKLWPLPKSAEPASTEGIHSTIAH